MMCLNYNESTRRVLKTIDLKGVFNTDAISVLVSNVVDNSPAYQAGIRK